MKSLICAQIIGILVISHIAFAGSYAVSAHGDTSNGVNRSSVSSQGYVQGNCAHCHEMHASIVGSEPTPVNSAPSPYAVFSQNFNTAVDVGPYQESDNFCFYCHNDLGSAQAVTNYDYSEVFGCATGGQVSILDAFNQTSYHNLGDIYSFAKLNFSWFTDDSNPCDACHNPHLAKRNWSDPDDPLLSAISKPSDHFDLWGTTQLMSTYSYESPYCSGTSREPAGVGATDGSETPDYVGFCTDCHNSTNTIYSTSLGGNLKTIDWGSSGDKHGQRNMDGGLDIEGPYSSTGGYVLSCLDCHEPHGSPNIMLIRRRVNGGDLGGAINTYSSNQWKYICTRCHEDDYDAGAGTGEQYRWKYVHHYSSDRPYVASGCQNCHATCLSMDCSPIDCDQCHYHGAVDSITGRINF